MPKNTLVFIYNSFKDPLFQNLMLSYLKTLNAKRQFGKFYLITFEQKRYLLGKEEKTRTKTELEEFNIYWRPLTFHSGKFLLLKKAWDFSVSFFKVLWFRVYYRTKIIFCFANVSASFGYIFSKLLQMKLMVYSYEPHSEFMVDLGYWSKTDLKYKLLNSLEWQAGVDADVIMTGTKWMVDELEIRGSRAAVYRTPTAVDPQVFKPDAHSREKFRTQLSFGSDDKIFIYVGKFGGLYYQEGIPILCKNIHDYLGQSKFLIVTSNRHEEIANMFAQFVPKEAFIITGNLTQEDLIGYLNASDFGLSGVPPSPNQKYRSPTKVAEYLLTGIPYITTKGVAEDDIYALDAQVGIVTQDFELEPDPEFYLRINDLMKERKRVQVNRIRQVGLEYRSKKRIDKLFFEIYSRKF